MCDLSKIADIIFTVIGHAGFVLLFAAVLYYAYSSYRSNSLTRKRRTAWVRSHFPEPEYTVENISDTSQFVAALLCEKDAAVWQYYDKFDEAHKVGSYDKLCSDYCCTKVDNNSGLLIIVTGNKVKISCNPYTVGAVLRIISQYKQVRCWIQGQSQYTGFSLETLSFKDMEAVLKTPDISLWGYVSAWEDVVFIPPKKYDNIDGVTYYTLFAVNEKTKCIYQPILKVAEERI